MYEGFLFKGNQLCVPDYSLRLCIIQELYGEGHMGRDRTLQLVRDSYFWPTICKEIERFLWSVATSIKCQREKQLTLGYICLYLY